MIPIEQYEEQWEPRLFRPRRDAVRAWRVGGGNLDAVARWCGGHTWATSVVVPVRGLRLPGESSARPGDWVVTSGDDGDFRVMSDADFRATFLPVAVEAARWQADEAIGRAGL